MRSTDDPRRLRLAASDPSFESDVMMLGRLVLARDAAPRNGARIEPVPVPVPFRLL